MAEIGWLRDLVILFGIAAAVVLLCHRLRIPGIVGFLLAGVAAGPAGLGVIHEQRSVEVLAEIGVVLLLFSIGIEFSLENLLRIRTALLLGGGLQVVLTTVIVGAIAVFELDVSVSEGTLLGMLIALSSTAIVLKLLSQRAEVESPHGRIALGILIFQDLCVVPMMLLVPFLAGGTASSVAILATFGKAAAMVALSLVLGKYVVPWFLERVVRTRSRELFLLVVLLVCLGTAWASAAAGLSLALGAFIAGLVVSQSEYSHQALGEIIPLRDVFSSVFLMSIGMLLERSVLGDAWSLGIVVLIVIGVKAHIVLFVTLLLRYPFRTGLIAGLGLAQIGEFSFVLARKGLQEQVLAPPRYQLFLAASIVTMLLAPVLLKLAPALAEKLYPFLPRRLRASFWGLVGAPPAELRDHVVIVGYGLNGKNLARVLGKVGVRYLVIEMNPETVARERRLGTAIVYGDASSRDILELAQVRAARVLVVVVSDPSAIRRIVWTARQLHPGLHIIVRTRFLGEVQPLLDLGANEVVPEEFETSLEIFSRTLRHLLVPRDTVERFVLEARADAYGVLRGAWEPARGAAAVSSLGGVQMEVLRVEEGSADRGEHPRPEIRRSRSAEPADRSDARTGGRRDRLRHARTSGEGRGILPRAGEGRCGRGTLTASDPLAPSFRRIPARRLLSSGDCPASDPLGVPRASCPEAACRRGRGSRGP